LCRRQHWRIPGLQNIKCEQDVVVQADDWLSKLADKFYGDVLAFQAIVQATNQANAADKSYAQIDNPDIIEIGWKLCIPSVADASTLQGTTLAAPRFDGKKLWW